MAYYGGLRRTSRPKSYPVTGNFSSMSNYSTTEMPAVTQRTDTNTTRVDDR